MKPKLTKEVKKVWKHIGGISKIRPNEFNPEDLKKMFDLFKVGDFYSLTFLPSSSTIEIVSDSIFKMLGYYPEEFTTDFFLSCIHPDDLPYFIQFEQKVVDFKQNLPIEKLTKYKSKYNFRIKNRDGTYIKVLQQSITIEHDGEGNIIRNLATHTDITELKSDNKMSLSFIGMDGEPSFLNVMNAENILPESIHILTKKEIEILRLLAKNKTTKQIANLLFISPETVKTHRKNILAKTETNSTIELLMKAVGKGWITTKK